MASGRHLDLGEPGARLLDGLAWAPLPQLLTSFVGREREREAVAGVLRLGETRLLTLTGPGGVGKTRLALRVAQEVGESFADGIVFVPLATIDEPAAVMEAVARGLGLRTGGDGKPLALLQSALRTANLLLVLDNMEQVTGAGPEVAALLGGCPGVTVLVTSRVPVHVSGEHEFAVPPLSLRSDAVELFVRRAREVRPGFELREDNAAAVEEVCRRLDGLPLAIELAAARSKVLAPTALLARLNQGMEILSGGPRDQPARLQTLRAAIAWSYDLLTGEEQRLFRRLGVFAGGFTLEAAEAVGERGSKDGLRSPGSSASVLDLVGALVDSSLLRSEDGGDGEPRCTMLETIRGFAVEQLERSGEGPAARDRHAAYFLALAEEAEPSLFGGRAQAGWVTRLEQEHDNLRAALGWVESDVRPESDGVGLRLAGSLAWFWYVLGHLREGNGWLERALARDTGDPTPARLQALLGLGLIGHRLGDDIRSIAVLDEAVAMAGALGDTFREGLGHGLRGIVDEDQGNYAAAAPYFERALVLIPPDPATPHAPVSALALMHRGVVAWGQGDSDRAVEAWNEALALHRTLGDAWGAANEQAYLGLVAADQGDLAGAVRLQRESLEAFWAAGAREEVAWLLTGIAVHLARREDAPGAARLFGAAETLRAAIGITPRYPERALFERTIAALRGGVGPDADLIEAAWAEGSRLALGVAVPEALAALATPGPVDGRTPDNAHGRASSLLSPRELEVMSLLVQGKSDREIADALFISRRTAQGHVAKIFERLGVSTRTAAVSIALLTNLLEDPSLPS